MVGSMPSSPAPATGGSAGAPRAKGCVKADCREDEERELKSEAYRLFLVGSSCRYISSRVNRLLRAYQIVDL
jgi:hypothetical protein